MKRIFLSMTAVALLLVMLAFTVSAAEPVKFGYYDTNGDGKVQLVDVFGNLNKMLNTDEDVSLLRVLETLKLTTSSEAVTASIKSINYDKNTVTLNSTHLSDFVLPFSAFGFENEKNMILYEEGKVIMTVPSPSKTFFTENYDASMIYAVKAECRYETNDLVLTADDFVTIDDVIMVSVDTVRDDFGADITEQTAAIVTFEKNGDAVDATVTTYDDVAYVPAESVYRALGAAVIWDEEAQTMTVKELVYPAIKLSNASGAPGEEVTVEATLIHNPGVAGAEFRINYDSAVASYVSGKKGANSFFGQFSPSAGANPVKVVLANLSLKDIAGDVVIGTVTFKIADDATPGTYELELSDSNLYDSQIVHLKSVIINSSITVTE